ncbi:MAG: acetyl-CoA carboxylase carboxyltransferase subunit alpha [Candidatus Binataceae bacterium]|nr:acetyl-CoA carboxylase carboxyltransferase subunit alpha [Candidatus Binataceae bacterium]
MEFPQPDLEAQMDELKTRVDRAASPRERAKLKAEQKQLVARWAASLSAIDRVRLARNPARPQTLDYVEALFDSFIELHGDRRFADDGAIVAGMALFGKRPLAIVGHQRGRSTRERLARNFGKPRPEGYRKAARMYELADRFGLPLITFVDTQGADPGVGAEERGQAEAIARNLELMGRLRVPVISCVIGEGGSGGALAVGVGNTILMQEYASYSVITPEGCAAILWRAAGPEKVAVAAAALKMSAPDLLALGIIDQIVPEPPGGAHRDPVGAAQLLGISIRQQLVRLGKLAPDALRKDRERKFSAIGAAYLGSRTEHEKLSR